MLGILDWLQNVGAYILSLVNLVVEQVRGLVQIIGYASTMAVTVPVWVGWFFPASVVTLVTLCISVAVIKLIIGRQ